MFKKLLLPLPLSVITLFVSFVLLVAMGISYYDANRNKIVQKNISCTFVSAEMKGTHILMKLACDGKEYKSNDSKLIYAHINNKPIIGDLQANDYVVALENDDSK